MRGVTQLAPADSWSRCWWLTHDMPTKCARTKIIAEPVWFPMRCHSVACGT